MQQQLTYRRVMHAALLLAVVLLFNAGWRVIAAGNVVQPLQQIVQSSQGIEFCFYLLIQFAALLILSTLLIPRFQENRKLIAFTGCFIASVVVAAALIVPGYYVAALTNGQTVQQMYGAETCWYHFLGRTLASTVTLSALYSSGALAVQSVRNKKREQVMEKEKLESELKFLRSQFNPHFLFNSINSIFFLIESDPAAASRSLASFSELLRYQLYECNDARIHLNKEINYLHNFIHLEKLRQNGNMQIDCDLPSQIDETIFIAPFILMTFVENAFKHVSKNSDEAHFIQIRMGVEQEQLEFQVTNSMSTAPINPKKDSGIGLANVQRRLDLIYPGKYQLNIQRESGRFTVMLRIHCGEGAIIKNMARTA